MNIVAINIDREKNMPYCSFKATNFIVLKLGMLVKGCIIEPSNKVLNLLSRVTSFSYALNNSFASI
jgi:hypothetical protein